MVKAEEILWLQCVYPDCHIVVIVVGAERPLVKKCRLAGFGAHSGADTGPIVPLHSQK